MPVFVPHQRELLVAVDHNGARQRDPSLVVVCIDLLFLGIAKLDYEAATLDVVIIPVLRRFACDVAELEAVPCGTHNNAVECNFRFWRRR